MTIKIILTSEQLDDIVLNEQNFNHMWQQELKKRLDEFIETLWNEQEQGEATEEVKGISQWTKH